ncbi:MAG: hypothetical protein COC15_02590 [Legionellales bacterium]|nr:MAG: hypothetical protein COC15_02590 [Legionellales bacterium]
MLIRLVVNNITSFGAEREFNMLPMPRLRTLKEHKYNIDNFDILKMASIYGANGSGKSNLVKSIYLLQQLVTEDQTSNRFAELEFKFKGNELQIPQVLVVEFFQDNKAFIYGIEILNNIISTYFLRHRSDKYMRCDLLCISTMKNSIFHYTTILL